MSDTVLLISYNKLLLQWCKLEFSSFFSISIISPENFSLQKENLEKVSCILIDFELGEELKVFYIFQYFAVTKNIPVILIYSKMHNLSKKRKTFYGNKFVSTFSQSGTLLKEVADSSGRKDLAPKPVKVHTIKKTVYKKTVLQPELIKVSFLDSNQLVLPEQSYESFDIFCGSSPKMKLFKEQVIKASQCKEIVLLVGESGTGKSYAAEYIHKHSVYKDKPWFKMNVAEVPETLAESHFFGVVQGAYTNAVKAKGIFEEASGSTLFLDEIGELPVELQTKLLDVIETNKFRKVGSMKQENFNGRLIFATNSNLEKKVRKGLFREDLYYRIAILVIEVPPLREHVEDIPFFVKKFINRQNANITNAAIDKLCSYDWPGNIRELNNVLKRAETFCTNDEIKADDIVFNSNYRSF